MNTTDCNALAKILVFSPLPNSPLLIFKQLSKDRKNVFLANYNYSNKPKYTIWHELTFHPSAAKIIAIVSPYVTVCFEAMACFVVFITRTTFTSTSLTILDAKPMNPFRNKLLLKKFCINGCLDKKLYV